MQCNTCRAEISGSYAASWNAEGEVPGSQTCIPCREIERKEEYRKDRVLRTHLWIGATLWEFDYKEGRSKKLEPLYQEILRSMSQVTALTRKVEERVWFGGMKTAIDNATTQLGWSNEERKVLTMCTAGRCMITLWRGDSYVSLITSEGNEQPGKMGVQGIGATRDKALEMLQYLLKNWGGTVVLKENRG